MAFFNWSDNLSVGVKALDDDHKKLMDMLNRLHEGMRTGQGKEVVGKILDSLVSYTVVHFSREEDLFARTGYPDVEHKQQHKDLVKKAAGLQSKYKSGECGLSIEILDFLKDWLAIHIQGADKNYSNHLNAAGFR